MIEPQEPGVAAETEFAVLEREAERRSRRYTALGIDIDPFPGIPPALLSSEHIKAYVRETGMVFPFDHHDEGRLKSASYEVNPGGTFIYWDEDKKKIAQEISRTETFTLPANSISFVQLDCQFRLPQYIAVRFNLRIQHVHRGLLLGTGPLVDPGFNGTLLVPLHNLTSEPYVIRGDEGLIWIEFTKTSHRAAPVAVRDPVDDKLSAIDPKKFNKPPEYYFDKSNKNRPIQSSIPLVVSEAKDLATKSALAADRAERLNRIFVGAGLLAVAGIVVALLSFFETVKANVIAAYNLSSTVTTTATQAAAEAKVAQTGLAELKGRFEATQKQLDDLKAELARLHLPTGGADSSRSVPNPPTTPGRADERR